MTDMPAILAHDLLELGELVSARPDIVDAVGRWIAQRDVYGFLALSAHERRRIVQEFRLSVGISDRQLQLLLAIIPLEGFDNA